MGPTATSPVWSLCPWQALSPEELNLTTEEVLCARVALVVCNPAIDAGSELPRLAPFLTIELLRRIHNLVAKYDQPARGGWCTHSALAKVFANVTGAEPGFQVRKEYEYAGNAMNTAVRDYTKPTSEWSRATKSAKECARKARKAGRDPPDAPR
eukprot:7378535-Prymnesium_polylepis.1